MRGIDLDASTRELMAPVCRSCLWWQQRTAGREKDDTPDERRRRDWERNVEEETGLFGRLLLEDGTAAGWLQAAPVAMVDRVQDLPAGTPSGAASLLTCAYFYDEDFLRGFQFLLLDLVAAMKHRGVTLLEAYALREVRPADRFRGYLRDLNLFNPSVLEGSGFTRVAGSGDVARYRLELETLACAPRRAGAVERAAQPATLPV